MRCIGGSLGRWVVRSVGRWGGRSVGRWVVGLKILGFHHVQITVPPGAEDEARKFYIGSLGMEEISKPDSLAGRGGFWLRIGSLELHVGTEGGIDRRLTKAHTAFLVDDLAGWRERLDSLRCPILDSIPIPGVDRFEFRDPFGNRLEMLAFTQRPNDPTTQRPNDLTT